MKKKIIIFNGVLTSGKSTLANNLAKTFKELKFFPEIGEKLRKEVNYNTLTSVESFDQEVMKRELSRDKKLINCINTPLVETWRTGNMAYILTRKTHVFEDYKRKFIKQLSLFKPKGIIISINESTFRNRLRERNSEVDPPEKEEKLLRFYKRLNKYLYQLYTIFNIDYIIVQNDDVMSNSPRILNREIFSFFKK